MVSILRGQLLGLVHGLRLIVGQRHALAAPFAIALMAIVALAKAGGVPIGLLILPDQVDIGHLAGFDGHQQGALSDHFPAIRFIHTLVSSSTFDVGVKSLFSSFKSPLTKRKQRRSELMTLASHLAGLAVFFVVGISPRPGK